MMDFSRVIITDCTKQRLDEFARLIRLFENITILSVSQAPIRAQGKSTARQSRGVENT